MALPEIKKVYTLPVPFPKRWQAVVFRNYGLVSTARIAQTLKTDEETVEREAKRLGLDGITYNPDWQTRGYATIVRSNWHLLDYEGLQTLLGVNEDELAFSLKEDDFLDVKMGNFKPETQTPFYEPLNESETSETKKIGEFVKASRLPRKTTVFDFYSASCLPEEGVGQDGGERIVYSFAAPYGDILLKGDFSGYSDELLAKLQKAGVNGVWMQGLLSQLSPHPYMPELSENYQIRRKNLNLLIEKLKKFGIKLYLYLNEPRNLLTERIPKDLRGHTNGRYTAFCSSKEETWEYLYNAVYGLAKETPDLGGIITITMSENLTHCKSKYTCNCSRCKDEKAELFAAKVNNVIYRAVKDAGSQAEVFANLWGWDVFLHWTPEQVERGIDALDKGISVMCVSETELLLNKGGVENIVSDYTLSSGRESERTKRCFARAKATGHRILAKIQVNNSWECSAVPYVPVFDLFAKHIRELQADGVSGYMLSWTLGGYPSIGLSLASKLIQDPQFDLEKWYLDTFGENAAAVHEGIKFLCDGFAELPFDVMFLYLGNLQMGAGNMWCAEKTGLQATMVGYPHDDIEGWKGKYPMDVFLSQMQKLVDGFKKGTKILEALPQTPILEEICTMAQTCSIHFESTLLQLLFNLKKETEKESLLPLIKRERELVKKLYEITCKDPRIGFEASNHYYYYENSLLEKLLNLKELEEKFGGKK